MADYVTITAGTEAYKGKGKPYVARLASLDRKFGFEREFLPRTANVYEPDLIEAVSFDKKDRKDTTFYVVVPLDGGLEKIVARGETIIEILRSGRTAAELDPYRDGEGKVRVRENGTQGALRWKAAQKEQPSPAETLAQIEAEAQRVDATDASLEEMRAAIVRIREIARTALSLKS